MLIFARALFCFFLVLPAAVALTPAQIEAVIDIAKRNPLKEDQILFRWQTKDSYEGLLRTGTFTRKLQNRFLSMKDKITFGTGLYMSAEPFEGSLYGDHMLEVVVPRGTPYLDLTDSATFSALHNLGISHKDIYPLDLPIHMRVTEGGSITLLKRAENVRFRKFSGEGRDPLQLAKDLLQRRKTASTQIREARDYLLTSLLTHRQPELVSLVGKFYGAAAEKFASEKGFGTAIDAEGVLQTYSRLQKNLDGEGPALRKIAIDRYLSLARGSPQDQLKALLDANILSDGSRSHFNESFLKRAVSSDDYLERLKLIDSATLVSYDDRRRLVEFLTHERSRTQSKVKQIPELTLGSVAPNFRAHLVSTGDRGLTEALDPQALKQQTLSYLPEKEKAIFSAKLLEAKIAEKHRFAAYLTVDPAKVKLEQVAETDRFLRLASNKAEAIAFLNQQGEIAKRFGMVDRLLAEIQFASDVFRALGFNVSDYKKLSDNFARVSQRNDIHPYSMVTDPASPYSAKSPAESTLQESYAKIYPKLLNPSDLAAVNARNMKLATPIRVNRVLDSLVSRHEAGTLVPELIKEAFAKTRFSELPQIFAQWSSNADPSAVEEVKIRIVHAVATENRMKAAEQMQALSQRQDDAGKNDYLKFAAYLSASSETSTSTLLVEVPQHLKALLKNSSTENPAMLFLERYPFLISKVTDRDGLQPIAERGSKFAQALLNGSSVHSNQLSSDGNDPLIKALDAATSAEEINRYTDALLQIPNLRASRLALASAAEKLQDPERLKLIVKKYVQAGHEYLFYFSLASEQISRQGTPENRISRAYLRNKIGQLFTAHVAPATNAKVAPLLKFAGLSSENPNKDEVYNLLAKIAKDTSEKLRSESLEQLLSNADLETIQRQALANGNAELFRFISWNSGRDPGADAIRHLRTDAAPAHAKTAVEVLQKNGITPQRTENFKTAFELAVQNKSVIFDNVLAAINSADELSPVNFPENVFTENVLAYFQHLNETGTVPQLLALLHRLHFEKPQPRLVKFLVSAIQTEADPAAREAAVAFLKKYVATENSPDARLRDELNQEFIKLLASPYPDVQKSAREVVFDPSFIEGADGKVAPDRRAILDAHLRAVKLEQSEFDEVQNKVDSLNRGLSHKISRPRLQGPVGSTTWHRCRGSLKKFLMTGTTAIGGGAVAGLGLRLAADLFDVIQGNPASPELAKLLLSHQVGDTYEALSDGPSQLVRNRRTNKVSLLPSKADLAHLQKSGAKIEVAKSTLSVDFNFHDPETFGILWRLNSESNVAARFSYGVDGNNIYVIEHLAPDPPKVKTLAATPYPDRDELIGYLEQLGLKRSEKPTQERGNRN